MKISGFSMVRNGVKLYYPIKECILSALPLVDEFVVALGNSDADDTTEKEILEIQSPKLKVIRTTWDLNKYPNGTENAHQTDIAKEACCGDWLLYLQADEVLHEKDLPEIKKKCREFLEDKDVEGFIFNYLHFWGDYNHYHRSHAWYKKDIRIVRNDKDIHSWESAQSFRRIPDFDKVNYRQQTGTFKLKVLPLNAHIFHYGYVRPPNFMQNKSKSLDTIHHGESRVQRLYQNQPAFFDYGALGKLNLFEESHPQVMIERIRQFHWGHELNYSTEMTRKPKHKHEKFKYRLLSWIENNWLSGRQLFTFRNYKVVRK